MRLHRPEHGDRILDVGCGFGDTTRRLAELAGPEGFAVGVDASPRFIDAASREAQGRPPSATGSTSPSREASVSVGKSSAWRRARGAPAPADRRKRCTMASASGPDPTASPPRHRPGSSRPSRQARSEAERRPSSSSTVNPNLQIHRSGSADFVSRPQSGNAAAVVGLPGRGETRLQQAAQRIEAEVPTGPAKPPARDRRDAGVTPRGGSRCSLSRGSDTSTRRALARSS
jgi:hypothetical protein